MITTILKAAPPTHPMFRRTVLAVTVSHRRKSRRRYDAHVPISGVPATSTPTPGKPALLLGAFDIASVGYVAEEFFVSGTASSYSSAAKLGPDGRWSVTPSDAADFTTRIVSLMPADRSVPTAQCSSNGSMSAVASMRRPSG